MKYIQDEKPLKKKIILKTFIVIGIVLMFILILFFSAMAIVCKGPSKSARDMFVTTCMETSFAKLFPPIYLSDAQIKEIQDMNTVVTTTDTTDTADIIIPKSPNDDKKDIEVIDIVGGTYKGKLMIVTDPSRLVVSCADSFGEESQGEKLEDMIEKLDGVAGINGGGFVDLNGVGTGGIPLGIVVRNGVFLNGKNGGKCNVIGFDTDNILHVGSMSPSEVELKKIRDAVCFGPPLIINGTPSKTLGNSGGLNPRTAIGQRKDGAVLLLVIDGRQSHSAGANFKDLIDVMTEHGAYNAGNLDGGSSSMLYYNGELVSTCASLYGPRKIPTGFVVLKK